jgi:hypothetical protein
VCSLAAVGPAASSCGLRSLNFLTFLEPFELQAELLMCIHLLAGPRAAAGVTYKHSEICMASMPAARASQWLCAAAHLLRILHGCEGHAVIGCLMSCCTADRHRYHVLQHHETHGRDVRFCSSSSSRTGSTCMRSLAVSICRHQHVVGTGSLLAAAGCTATQRQASASLASQHVATSPEHLCLLRSITENTVLLG